MKKKSLCWLVVAMMLFCVIASGGCGGGSSSNSSGNSNDDDHQNDNPQDAYSISIISGAWTASNGSGTATGSNGTFDLRMVHVNASFSNVQVNGSTATAIASVSAEWDAYQNGRYVLTHYSDYNQESVEIHRVGENTWRYTFPDGDTVTVTITSTTTANITEEGSTSEGYRYTANYTVTKDDPNDPTTYDIGALQGTWTVSSGAGSASGNGINFELALSEGSLTLSNVQANTDSFTGDLSGIIYWRVYQNGVSVRRVGLRYSRIDMQRLSGNSWRTSDGNITLTVLSETTASIREKGTVNIDGYQYEYEVVYDMSKN